MKLIGFGKRMAAVMAASLMMNVTGAAADTGEQLATLQGRAEGNVRRGIRGCRMYGTKSYRGVTDAQAEGEHQSW